MPSPASSGGSGGGGTVFIPPNQAGAASQLGDILNPLAGLAANAGAGTPGGTAYPAATNLIEQYLTGAIGGGAATPFNDFSNTALQGSSTAAGYGASTLFPQGTGASSMLYGAGQEALPYANTALQNGFSPAYGSIIDSLQQNPFYQGASSAAQQGAGYGAAGGADLFGRAGNVGALSTAPGFGDLTGYAQNTLQPQGTAAMGYGFDPGYGSLVSSAQNNPFLAGAYGGAQAGAGYGAAGAGQAAGLAGQVGGAVPGLMDASSQILGTGFDPQSALFRRGEQQLFDQSNVANAMSGVANTPYGASVTANALGNYDINWQNNQLARQTQALGAAGSGYGQGAGLANSALGLSSGASDLSARSGWLPSATMYQNNAQIAQALQNRLGAAGQGLGFGIQGENAVANALNTQLGAAEGGLSSAAGGYSQAAGLPISTGGAPSSVFQNYLNSILGGLNARNQAGAQGAAGYGSLYGSAGSGFSNAQNLGYGAATQLSGLSGLPYNTGSGIAGNAMTGLTNLTNLGNNQFALPQQVIADLMQYMGLGQAASTISGNLGNLGVSQLGGAIGGVGSLLGSGGPFGGGPFGGGAFGSGGALSGLFGGGAASGLPAVGSIAGGATAADALGGLFGGGPLAFAPFLL